MEDDVPVRSGEGVVEKDFDVSLLAGISHIIINSDREYKLYFRSGGMVQDTFEYDNPTVWTAGVELGYTLKKVIYCVSYEKQVALRKTDGEWAGVKADKIMNYKAEAINLGVRFRFD